MTQDIATTEYSIAAVERDTGLSKDTLRVWERRYGFPHPDRDDNGERVYPGEQLEKLRLIKRLLDQGYRPAALMKRGAAELDVLLASSDRPEPGAEDPAFLARREEVFAHLQAHRNMELRSTLGQALMKQGLQRFVIDTVAPLNTAIGDAWMRGEIDVPREHLYTEQLQNLLRSAINGQSGRTGSPDVLLTTFPDELHALGLLMVEAMLVPEGAQCVSLGTQTPVQDIRNVAVAGGYDVVALSFSAAFPIRQAIDGLLELRAGLPRSVEIWVGGSAVSNKQRRLPGIHVVTSLVGCVEAVRRWRKAHSAS